MNADKRYIALPPPSRNALIWFFNGGESGGAEGRQRGVNEGEKFWGGILLIAGSAGGKVKSNS